MATFNREAPGNRYETFNSNAHFERGLSVYVSATTEGRVRINNIHDCGSAATYYTAEQCRLVAAELLLAAESLPVEQAIAEVA